MAFEAFAAVAEQGSVVDQMRGVHDSYNGIIEEAYSWVTADLSHGFIAASALFGLLYGAGRIGRAMGKKAKD